MEERKNPDRILEEIQREEQKTEKGRLKIFFGYAAGVGKTCAMLDAARTDLMNGMDVLAGYIEPHARPDTIAMLQGYEVLSPLTVEYKGIKLKEFDLDAALLRKPGLILVDELAHTNAPGCRHAKRYQDVRELIEAGIDVYTTVNVQHLESLNDIVASITQVKVQERIPDSIFDEADQVELVDIEPEQLIQRLNAGKIYRKAQAERAAGHFFLKENLTALREIALRRTADRVNQKVMEERSAREGADYYTGERILICISPSPSNEKVIRTAARMAGAFKAELIALHVETPGYENADPGVKQAVYEHMNLAKQFGARASVLFGDNIPYQIAEYSKAAGISKIVIGRSAGTGSKSSFFRQNLIDRLILQAPNLDIYVIPDQTAVAQNRRTRKKRHFSAGHLLKAAGILGLTTALGMLIYELHLGNISVAALYIAATVLAAWVTADRLFTAGTAVAGVCFYNLFFTEPRMTFNVNDPIYPFTFAVLLAVSLVTGELTVRLKRQGKQDFLKSRLTETLLNTSQKLRRTNGAEEIIRCGAVQITELLGCSVAVYELLGETMNPEIIHPCGFTEEEKKKAKQKLLTEAEHGVAAWVKKTGHRAGRKTDTLPGASGYYVPVSGENRIFAVYGIGLDEREAINPFDKNILKAMINETAFAAEKYVLLQEQKKMMLDAEREKLRSNLLRAVSHDLKTPMSCITGYSSMLMDGKMNLSEEEKRGICQNLYEEAFWLNSMVENLLTVTRLDTDEDAVRIKSHYLSDIITEALKHVNRDRERIQVVLPESFIVKGDGNLLSRVLRNILDNSIRYTQQDSSIEVSARREDKHIIVEVADNGPGIPDEEKERIFDLYFKCSHNTGDSRRGLGLGLSLCRTIMDAHGGSIYVRNQEPCGAVFGFTLEEGSME